MPTTEVIGKEAIKATKKTEGDTTPEDTGDVSLSTPTVEEEDFAAMYVFFDEQHEFMFNSYGVTGIYNALSDPEFTSLAWPFRYYSEILDSADTERLNQGIKDDFTAEAVKVTNTYQLSIHYHKIFKNLLFNIKQIFILKQSADNTVDSWTWREMSYSSLEQLYAEENSFYIAKISMGQKIKDSLNTMGMEFYNTSRGIATKTHDVGYKYFIISSEPMTMENYLNILPQTYDNEDWFVETFDDIGEELPEFNNSVDTSYTALKSNYVFQSSEANMTLKGIKKETSTTETTGNITTVSTQNTGY